MSVRVHQGDIIKIGGTTTPILVVSQDFFNETGLVIGCPIDKDSSESPLHILINTQHMQGNVCCEDMKKFDLHSRGCSIVDHVNMIQIINIVDAIQGIFDYI